MGAAEPAEAAHASLRAAARAERMHAPAEAHSHLETALAHFDALPTADAKAAGRRGELLARAAEAAYLGGEFDRAVALAESALEEVHHPTLKALRWERLARYRWVNRDGAGAQRAHIRSVSTLPRDAPVGDRRGAAQQRVAGLGRRPRSRGWMRVAGRGQAPPPEKGGAAGQSRRGGGRPEAGKGAGKRGACGPRGAGLHRPTNGESAGRGAAG